VPASAGVGAGRREARRPILLNGITDYVTRSDLVERTVPITLPAIPDSARRDEEELWAAFERARPMLLGALLDDVAGALHERPHVALARRPRMADFALWSVAAERGRREPDRFLRAYMGAREAGHDLTIDGSPIGLALRAFLDAHLSDGSWEGTAGQLLKHLVELADDQAKRSRDWPRSPRGLSGEIRRVAPALRGIGFTIVVDIRDRARKRGRLLRIGRVEEAGAGPSAPSAPSDDTQRPDTDAAETADSRSADADGWTGNADGRADGPTSDADGVDGCAPTPSPDGDALPRPDQPCYSCRSEAWRQRPTSKGGGWVCGICHPATDGSEAA
jgi:hypothetical protein